MVTLLLFLSLAWGADGTKRKKKVISIPKKEVKKSEEESSLPMLIGGGAVLLAGGYLFFGRSNEEQDLLGGDSFISDEDLRTEQVLTALEGFEPKLNNKLKYGYTENSVGKQLFEYLNERFETVAKEYSIGGNRPTKVDFCIGNPNKGTLVGIELKILSKLFKSAELQRLHGQIADYKALFSEDNLIVLAVGEEVHFAENASLQEVVDRVHSQDALLSLVEIPTKTV